MLTREEKEIILNQLNYRVRALEELMCEAGKNNKVERVRELANGISLLKSGISKILNM